MLVGVLAILLLSSNVAAQTGRNGPPTRLGTWPICETSAARVVPCEGGSGAARCVVVGDNEVDDKLFLFRVNDAGELTDPQELGFKFTTQNVKKIDDIEALEVDADGVLVFGSHSRKSFKPDEEHHCEVDGGRLTFARLQRHGAELSGAAVKTDKQAWRELLTSAGCGAKLIAIPAAEQVAEALAQKACAAIAEADTHAEQDPAACSRAFNIEGVVSLPGHGGTAPRIWIGLRSPLVDGKAVLLRLHDVTQLQFDGIALITLDGLGVRDLAYARGTLWVLAGPMADEAGAGSVWTVPADQVTSGAELGGHHEQDIAALPAFAEGLAIDERTGDVFVIVDGDAGKASDTAQPPACKVPAGQVLRNLPASTPSVPPSPVAAGHGAADPACDELSDAGAFAHAEIGTIPLRSDTGSGTRALLFRSQMAVDTDGAPDSYHPDNIGITHICNGVSVGASCTWTPNCLPQFRQARAEQFRGPTKICFFGMAVDSHGRPIVQGPNDAKPGFFVSTTAFKNPHATPISPAAQLDSNRIHYIVVPGKWVKNGTHGIGRGDFAVVLRKSTGAVAFAVVGDTGPGNKLGEGSVALHQALGNDPFLMRHGVRRALRGIDGRDVLYVVFSGSRVADQTMTPELIDAHGRELLARFGGAERLRACAR